MTQRTRDQLIADADSSIPDNVAGLVSPADVRGRVKDLAQSTLMPEDMDEPDFAATAGSGGFMSAADKSKLDGIAAGATANDTDANLKNRANHTGTQTISTIDGLQSALDGKQSLSAKGQANGYASLDSTGKIPMTQMPDAMLGAVRYQGLWDADTNTPSIPAADSENAGHYYIVSVPGSTDIDGIDDWEIGDWIISDGNSWGKVDNTDQVTSVNGKRGAVTLNKSDVGLGNVDNTSDLNKPISTAVQLALDGKASTATATTSANGLMSAADKAKLDGIETGATANMADADLLDRGNHTGTQPISSIEDLEDELAALQPKSQKGAANGYASLDSNGKVPLSELPDAVIGGVRYISTWDADTNSPTIPAASSSNRGHYYVVSVAGTTTIDGISDWEIGDWIISDGSSWGKIDNTDQVISVNGKKGAVTLTKSDVGLGNVDNTSDMDKPISNAVSAALAGKASTAVATQTTDGLLSAADKVKLDTLGTLATHNAYISFASPMGGIDHDFWFRIQ